MALALLPLASMSRAMRLVAMSSILQNIVNETVPRVEIKSSSPLMQFALSNGRFGRVRSRWLNESPSSASTASSSSSACEHSVRSDDMRNNNLQRDTLIPTIKFVPSVDTTVMSDRSTIPYLNSAPIFLQIHTNSPGSGGGGGGMTSNSPSSASIFPSPLIPGNKIIILHENSASLNSNSPVNQRNWAIEAAIGDSSIGKQLNLNDERSITSNRASLSILSNTSPVTSIHLTANGASMIPKQQVTRGNSGQLIIVQEKAQPSTDLTEASYDQNSILLSNAMKGMSIIQKDSEIRGRDETEKVTSHSFIHSTELTNGTKTNVKSKRNGKKKSKISRSKVATTLAAAATTTTTTTDAPTTTREVDENKSVEGEQVTTMVSSLAQGIVMKNDDRLKQHQVDQVEIQSNLIILTSTSSPIQNDTIVEQLNDTRIKK